MESLGSIEQFLDYIDGILWGPILLIGLLGTGIWFTCITKFWQVRHFLDAVRFCCFPKKTAEAKAKSKDHVSPYKAAAVAIASTIGPANIGGVASAIALGGPGALFWMWMTGLVGMMTKMVEVTLAVYYRKANPDGTKVGGPLYYIEKGLGGRLKFWKALGIIFVTGLMMQLVLGPEAYTVGEALHEVLGIKIIYLALFFSVMCAIVVYGGLKRVYSFAALMMPLMSVTYMVFALYVILVNIVHIPAAIVLIVKSAFTPMSAVGGFTGASFILIARTGIARGLFSNEAGWGTSPMVHATAENRHPVEQGMWGIVEVFVDTMVICTITGLVIILTGEWSSGATGSVLTINAFSSVLGKKFSAWFIAVSLFIFSWTSSTGWFTYHYSNLGYVFQNMPRMKKASILWLTITQPWYGMVMAYLVCVLHTDVSYAWLLVDISSAIPTYVNLFVILLLTKTFMSVLKDYEGPKKLMGLEEYDKVKFD